MQREGKVGSITPRTGRIDSDYAAAPHDRYGSDDLYRMDL